ncbi:MAG: CxxxxCH/CxxCH domain-containing protein [Deltaproteobacteria bacterium]|nr:CxxxxCH/CxxCH domain-containing protein [Deltaproteobacteria bacterium]
MNRTTSARLAPLVALFAFACAKDEPSDPVLVEGCRSCHGSRANPAPPKANDGSTDRTARSVGAHQAHLLGGVSSRNVPCEECHRVPENVDDEGHLDALPGAELVFSGASTASAATPLYDSVNGSCANTYCHGAKLTGGTQLIPTWTSLDPIPCGGCHGLPPPAPHPESDRCETCHDPVAGRNKTIVERRRHGDGVLDVVDGAACFGCHGSGSNSAPPRDLDGASDPSLTTVGSHQEHLSGGQFSRPVECEDCHLVPAQLDSPGHVDSERPAELFFGELARADGALPAWNRTDGTCANSYCHGATLEGATRSSPIWTDLASPAECGACHAVPPASPHPANERCELCHLPTAGPNKSIANRATHVNGIVEVAIEECVGCHGNVDNLAPPVDMAGKTETTLRTVGAHQTHLTGGQNAKPVACDACHVVPDQVDDPNHRDAPPSEVILAGLPNGATGATGPAEFDGVSCSGSPCHAGPGAENPSPVWVKVDGTEAKCGSCHALPPPAPHPAADRCELCHEDAGPNQVITDRSKHVNGVVEATDDDCTACHGSPESGAPPKDVSGRTDPSLPTVGAHLSHLTARNHISLPVACNSCHLVPSNVDDPGHVDTSTPAEVTYSALASKDTTPSWNRVEGTCANYCHGATLDDGSMTLPIWTLTDGSQTACGTCHGAPPGSGHPNDDACEKCHAPTAGPGKTIADPSTHLDGILQASEDCTSCHGSPSSSAPPNDLDGQAARSLPTVGAHQAHLSGGKASQPVACQECHLVPSERADPGHDDTPRPAELTFGAIAAKGTVPAYGSSTCSDTYCHGLVGATQPNPTWTDESGAASSCDACHGMPPNTPVHASAGDCSMCHLPTAGPDQTIANRATHVDGIVEAANVDCATCHGDADSSAPPADLNRDTADTDPQVGTHRAHVSGGTWSAPVPCDTCHVVPDALESPGHVDTDPPAEVSFSGRASGQLLAPRFVTANLTCAETYCHGATTSLGTNETPTWNSPGTVDCDGCHGLPPAAPHPQLSKCELCHAAVGGPNHTIVNKSRHVDGITDVDVDPTCERCHGTPASPAPPSDLSGQTTSPKVGAHAAHVTGTGNSAPVACGECHLAVDPNNVEAPGHFDSAAPAEVTFGALSRVTGLTPSLNGGNCSNTYCHGASLTGGTTHDPSWTAGDMACDACHGNPPADTAHGNGTATQCEKCHPDTAGPGRTIVRPQNHVNGVIDTSATCDACHGQNGDPTPPRDLAGNATGPKVGAHAAHRAPAYSVPVACTSCHLRPTEYGDPGHADTQPPAELTFAGLARTDGTNPTYSTAAARCTNTYCHGATMPGGATQAIWTGPDVTCTSCHGMPPSSPAHASVSGPDSCDRCHEEVAGPNQVIVNPTLHVDGIVEASGGACDSCHGSPPAPGNESYAGSAGAHAKHSATLGFACSTCHGNDGSGPQHDEGNGTVTRANVDLVFDTAVTFPGGTTMRNNQANATYNQATQRCAVGCHNPILGNPPETPSLAQTVTWSAGPQNCVGCHETVQTAMPRSHDISALGNAACLECHDQANHTRGLVMRDPDPADGFVYSTTNFDGLCKTCHDGGGGTAFGGKSARNVSAYWTTASHGAENIACNRCHTYHASTSSGPLFVDDANASCMASGCHNNLATEFGQVPNGPISHHRIEGGTGIQLKCVDCHNPHLARPHPLAASNPDDLWTLYSLPDDARLKKISTGGNFRAFCLACHDATEPPGVTGAMNISQALSGGSDPSFFRKGTESLHKKAHSGYNCMNCHDDHASTGSGGINRGRLLRSYIIINQFTNNNYPEERNCSTPNVGASGNTFRCH